MDGFNPRKKLVRHKCGYQLQSQIISVVSGKVVVSYRDYQRGGGDGLVVTICPGCRTSLPLWWDDPGGAIGQEWEAALQRMIDGG